MRTRSLVLMLALLASLLVMPTAASAQDSAEICDTDALVEAVESGPEEGTLAGMADDPVGTAASSNPVLTTLVTAVSAAGLVDTLNSAEALTVFAPTDCAFAALDQATLDAALADPEGLLTTVLGYHVIAGEMIASADLEGEYEAFTGETITVNGTDVDGQATIVVPDIETANATVHLIDTVMLPPSVSGAAQDDEATEDEAADAPEGSAAICDTDGLVEAVEGGPEEGTLAGMADDPVGTAASSNPVLTTLVTAVSAAGLVDTLNSAEALTVFAPTDCAFAELDSATLDAALADPSGLLTTVLGFHVIAGEMIASADLSGDYETFTGETITVNGTDVDGQATILVPDVMTANATVHLIDTVMLPPSVTEAAQDGDAEMEDGAEMEEGAEEEAAPVPTGGVATGAGGTAASSASTPLVAMGLLAMLALGLGVVARRKA